MILQTATKHFEKELLLMHKRGKDIKKLIRVTDLLVQNITAGMAHHLLLPSKYCLHKIVNMSNIWNCYIEPNWLLLYYLGNKPFSELAYGDEFERDMEFRYSAYIDDRVDLSLSTTYKLPLELEFSKRYNEVLRLERTGTNGDLFK